MSLFYMTVKNINKAKQSAVASASYRSGESLYSERDNETKSYGVRAVMPETHIVAPSHAPEWVHERERLWNEVESVEKNYNSRLAREVLVALPVELSKEKQTQMLIEFAKENFVSRGIVADISIHRDKEHNPHAHIMLTTRPFNEDGSWGNKKRKEYIFDEKGNNVLDHNGKKTYKTIALTDWDKKETLLTWRKNYAEKINQWYKQEGINEQVSHESYESQGLDRLPKQRLTLEEYRYEKRQQEVSKKNGTEYEPKSYYAKLNQEIDIQNKLIDEKNKKIVSLEAYRELAKQEVVAHLDNIRNAKSLSSSDRLAIKTVAGRVKSYVDYENAKDNLNKLANWKEKIDFEKNMLDARAKVLVKAIEAYKSKPEQSLLYGIQPQRFNEEYSKLVNEFKVDQSKFNTLMNVYTDLYEKSRRVFEIQRKFTVEEFDYLYPKYANIHNDNDNAFDVKAKYVSLFKQEGFLRENIPEFEVNNKIYQNDFVELSKLVDDWKNVNKSLVVLERTKEKRKEEYRDSYKNNYDQNKVYRDSIRYTNSRDQIALKEGEIAELSSKIFNEVVKRYPDVSPDFIKEIPTGIQSRLLELHVNDQQTGKLSNDLETVQEHYYKGKNFKAEHTDNEYGEEKNASTFSVSNTGEMIIAFINNARNHEKANDDLERLRKSQKKQNKKYRDIGEREI